MFGVVDFFCVVVNKEEEVGGGVNITEITFAKFLSLGTIIFDKTKGISIFGIALIVNGIPICVIEIDAVF